MELGVLVSATASTLVPPAFGVTAVLSTPRVGSSVATSDAISTGWLFEAAVALGREHDRTDLLADPPRAILPRIQAHGL